MPGMMDTILNLGLNDEAAEGLAERDGQRALRLGLLPPLPADVRRRRRGRRRATLFEDALTRKKRRARRAARHRPRRPTTCAALVDEFRRLYREGAGDDFPQDPREQLRRAIDAVFRSWDDPRARVYRRANEHPGRPRHGRQRLQMVFGNMGDDSATGVCFTRDPSTGEQVLYGEFLRNAQGEDVVAGIRTPRPIGRAGGAAARAPTRSSLETIDRLEAHYRDVQDIEFTVERGTLYLLQTRTGKRTAAGRPAHRARARRRGRDRPRRGAAAASIPPSSTSCCTRASIRRRRASASRRGLNASPGAAVGAVVFDADTRRAPRPRRRGASCSCAGRRRPTTSTACIQAQGVLTAHGGMTSHAAVVARGMGKPCVAGARRAARSTPTARTLTRRRARRSPRAT